VWAGIPRNYLLGTKGAGVNTRAIAAQNTSQLDSTIQWWRRTLSGLLTEVYTEIYGDADAAAVATHSLKRRRGFDATAELEKNYINVHFTPEVIGGVETLMHLYKCGVINFDTYAQCSLRSAGLYEDGSGSHDYMSAEDKKRMVLTGMTTQQKKN
jgi:hypothetical protein